MGDNWWQKGAAGAAAGGAAGGPLGAAVGGVGGLIWGGVEDLTGSGTYQPPKGTAGAFDTDTYQLGGVGRSQYDPLADDYRNRQAQTTEAATIDRGLFGDAAGARGFQQENISDLFRRARGLAPSAAEMQMRQGLDRSLDAQMAALASMRGGNVGAGSRLAADQSNDLRMQVSGQAAELRAREQAQAEQTLAQALAGMRGQDIGQAQFIGGTEAGFRQQTGQFNADAALRMQGLNDQMVSYYTNLGYSIDEANRQARMDMERLKAEIVSGQMADATTRQGQVLGAGAQAVGALAQGAGSAGAAVASDRRLKKNIEPGDEDVALSARAFDYKDERHGRGRHLGVMAQDLERSKIGREMVTETPGGKMVSKDKMLMAALASSARLAKRVDMLEAA
jgi:hypothetical protein